MNSNYSVEEFRGTDELYAAEVLTDDNEVGSGYTTGSVFKLAPVAEISKTTESSSEVKYYDNLPANVVQGVGADTITLTVPALPLDILAAITGKDIDSATGALMDGEANPKKYALGYRIGLTDGTYRYVWRYKGTFAIPDETSQTKDASTTTNNQSLTYTGLMTQHKFTKPNATQRALVVDERDDKADLSTFFVEVTTIDTLQAKTPATEYTVTNTLSHCTNSNTATKVTGGAAYSATITADDTYTLGTVTVTMGGTDITSTAVTGGSISIAEVTGNIVITATAAR